ncbi:MAG: pyridoxine 5'-phosphate synthase [Bacteroidia bacterium]
MCKLSVNINKIATLRNARGGLVPDVKQAAIDCERFGAQGITVHPRPDERHIRRSDVIEIKKNISIEFNIEGFPSKKFIQLVKEIKPEQVTLVPDAPHVITSNAGWDTFKNKSFLKEIVSELKSFGCRVSLFVDPDEKMIEFASETGTDRIELYTEAYAKSFPVDKDKAIAPYIKAANKAKEVRLGINAGHDLNLKNLRYLFLNIPHLQEVSIGHALISDSLYYGLENTIQLYLRQLKVWN